VLVQPPQPPQPPVIQGLTPAPGTPNPMRFRYYGNRPQVFTWTGEDGVVSQQAEKLAQKLAEAKSDGDREKIKSQLMEVLEKQFDQRQKRHEEEIKQLEAQIKKLKDLVDKRQENRREIIARRLDQIVRESQGLGW
jgi:DNA anti-recombination protein RmuC